MLADDRHRLSAGSMGSAGRRWDGGLMSNIPLRLACAAAALTLMTVPAANASVPGLQRVSASSLNDSLFTKDAAARCPPGQSVLGGGARIFPGNGQVVVDGITPNTLINTVFGRGFE